jgi:phosphoribosylaminoimidazolecarboxamide formyltransferase / IMP cyclohydrolase
MASDSAPIKRALISVFDKTAMIPFVQGLAKHGAEILASGGTAKALEDAGVTVRRIEVFTGAQEVLGGRVKTLHPKVHAGILADRRDAAHMRDLQTHDYQPIDMVVCNLYPFAQYLREGKDRAALIEKIDIGGPTLLRAAAKNVDGGVAVVGDPADYDSVVQALAEHGGLPSALRRKLAAKAFRQVADYDLLIAGWAEEQAGLAPENGLPQTLQGFNHHQSLRYGENPHQRASLYRAAGEGGIASGTLLGGKELSYNNYLDMDAAYRAAYVLQHPGCAIIKHTNPCGLAQAATQAKAFERALAGDPVSAFGSVIGFNTEVDVATVRAMQAAKLFVECIAAPAFSQDAMAELKKKENLRLFVVAPGNPAPRHHAHRISGGLLVQEPDAPETDTSAWKVVTRKPLEESWLAELDFAMKAATLLKSNAIALTHGQALLGAGAGQMSRVDAAEQAIKKAGAAARGAFMGSDAFFPFPDCVKLAADAGVVAIVQPGGSKRDQESIDACNELGIAMVFTGRRHFRH